MEDLESWLAKINKSTSIFSNSSSLSSSSTNEAPTLYEDSSFSSSCTGSTFSRHTTTKYYSSPDNNYPIQKTSVSHFCISSINTTASQISCLAVQNNILYAATIKEINVIDLTTLSLIETFGSGSGWVKSIAFSDNKIFTAHQDCRIRVWQKVSTKQKHQIILTLPTFKDRLLNCLRPKNYVQVRRHKQKLWIQHADAVSGLAVNNDLGQLYSVSWDKSFKTWKISSDMKCVDSVTTAHSDAINAVVVDPSDGTVYTGSADGQIKVWAPSTDKRTPTTTLSKHNSSVNALALTRGGSGLVSGGGDGVILVWQRRDGGEFFVACCLKGHRGAVLSLGCVNDFVISGSSDTSVRIWRGGKGFGCCLAVMEGHLKPVKSLVAVQDEDLDVGFSVLSGSLDGEIKVWKVSISKDSD